MINAIFKARFFKIKFSTNACCILIGSLFLPLKKDWIKSAAIKVNPWSQWAGWDLASCWCLLPSVCWAFSSRRYDHRLGLPPRQARPAASRQHRSSLASDWSPGDHASLWLADGCTDHGPLSVEGWDCSCGQTGSFRLHNLTLHPVQRLERERDL